jgi:hypothetical protein
MLVLCRACGHRHEATGRCLGPIVTGPIDEGRKGPLDVQVWSPVEFPKNFEPKPVRLAKARELVGGDCTNPGCPYRAEVMRMRELNRKRGQKFRKKEGTKG